MADPDIWLPFSERLRSSAPFQALLAAQRTEAERLPPAAAAWVVDLLARERDRAVLAVVPHESEALAWQEGAALFGRGAVRWPAPSLTPYRSSEPSLGERLEACGALAAMATEERPVVVTTARAWMRRLPPRAEWRARRLVLQLGVEAPLEELAAALVAGGYTRGELVVEPGQFAIRGGVVDIFAAGDELPVRLEFMGDTVETMRHFDPESQRSGSRAEVVEAWPLEPFGPAPGAARRLARYLETLLPNRPSQAALAQLDALAEGDGYAGWTRLLPAVSEGVSLSEWLADPLLVIHDADAVRQELRQHAQALGAEHRRAALERAVPAPEELEFPLDLLADEVDAADLSIGGLTAAGDAVDFGATLTDLFHRQLPRFPREVESAAEHGEQLVVVSAAAELRATEHFLEETEIPRGPGGVELATGELTRGFRLPPAGAAVVSDRQLFARPAVRRRPQARPSALSGGLGELRVGDYVVHRDHGIGRLQEFRTIHPGEESAGPLPAVLEEERPTAPGAFEALVLAYAEGRTLLLPLSRIDAIHRYGGVEGAPPRLDRLGGASWNARTERVKRGMLKLAGDLVRLYAEREVAKAPAMPPPGPVQREFAADFEHQETPDQLAAIEAVTRDLQRPIPMDRLLCGDVGFGKTEVAMRAALQVVEGGFQVAVLAPTTILADQHLETFRERFRNVPVTVEMVSRFRSAAEIREVLERAAAGQVDILIGTHRLLSRDVKLPRLGLVIVDEEQRFGVAQKERFKELKRNLHVLALSATPVPRTLQMGLAGVRDISVIETPPRNRLAVETAIVPLDEELVREAIEHELDRGGQVYYVHNRVASIQQVAEQLRELVPEARITIGHGQLPEEELARRMHAFKSGESDLLLATSIIENGIDISRVNTMLIHRAERFGLAQLYQLRGRVGRSDALAYCYLLVPRDVDVSPEARQRLEAIREFTELGSGFRVAARDLEIRGAGNLLGAEQSGHIAAVGIETYMRLLEEAVRELKGESVEAPPSTVMELPVEARIPEEYMGGQELRMALYREIATRESSKEMLAELDERFGPPPQPTRRLVELAALKRRAEALRVQSIRGRGRSLEITLRRDARVDPDELIRLVGESEGGSFSPQGVLKLPKVAPEEMISTAWRIFDQIATDAPAPVVAN